eukprot:1182491-Prorocentrum_minimum.AAC.3
MAMARAPRYTSCHLGGSSADGISTPPIAIARLRVIAILMLLMSYHDDAGDQPAITRLRRQRAGATALYEQ